MKNFNKSHFWLVLIGLILIFGYRSYLKRNPIEKAVDESNDITDNVETLIVKEPVSKYLGNQLTNGASPYDGMYGKGVYSEAKNSLEIINKSSSDVIVMLINLDNDKVIRNEYVRANSEFKMTNIPNATCYTKYYYGSNWNPTRMVKGKKLGGFDSNEQFVLSNKPRDYLSFTEFSQGQYIYFSEFVITLETIISEGQTMSESHVSPETFF